MGTHLVVTPAPVLTHASYLAQSFKHIAVEYLLAIGSVEAFDEAVLHRPSGLNEPALDAMTMSPFLQVLTDKFRPVVHAQLRRPAAQLDQFGQGPHNAPARQADVDLDAQGLTVEVVDDVEGTEAPSRPQRI